MDILKPGEKSNDLFKRFERYDEDMTNMTRDWPHGCVFDKGTEFRVNDDGKIEFRVCRRVRECDDRSYNHEWECEDWKDY